MKGSILKRGENKHLLRVSLGRDETTGKRLTKSKTFIGKYRAAEKALREWLAQIEDAGVVTEDRGSLNRLLQEWLKSRVSEVAEGTLSLYTIQVRLYFTDDIGKLPLNRVTTEVVRDFYHRLAEKGLSASVLRLVHSILSQALDMAVEQKRLVANPATAARRKRRRKAVRKAKIVRSFTLEQANRFLGIEDAIDRMLYSTALVSGARPGEYLGLTWPCVDWERNEIQIQHAMVQVRDGVPRLGNTKTDESRRTIAMPEEYMAELKEHRKRLAELRKFAGRDWEENDLVFPTNEGKLQRLSAVRKRFKSHLKRAQLPGEFRLYDLRHTCATLLLQDDESIRVISERLGHATVTQTLETYVHVLPTMQRRAADKLGNMFFRAGKAA